MSKKQNQSPQILSPENYIRQRARNLPIFKCFVNEGWDEEGLAHITIARKHVNGNVTYCSYLVDLRCLGIKDTLYEFNVPEYEFDEYKSKLDSGFVLFECEYNLVHNIIHAGWEYAEDIGFEPHKDFLSITRYMLEEDKDEIPLIDIHCGGENGIPGDLMSDGQGVYFDKPHINMGSLDLCTTGFQVKKTGNPYSPAAGIRDGQDETGFIIIRLGEVLLNYAEALYELKGMVAYDALNQIRSRAGMPNFMVNNQFDDPNHQDYGYPISDELYEIRRERRVELALEGHRDEDLFRWAAHNLFKGKRPKGYPFNPSEFPSFSPKLDENGLIDYHQSNLPNGYKFRENQDYLYSISQQELVLNPNLVQNPGW